MQTKTDGLKPSFLLEFSAPVSAADAKRIREAWQLIVQLGGELKIVDLRKSGTDV